MNFYLKQTLNSHTNKENFTKNPSRIDKNNARFGRPEKNVNKKLLRQSESCI